MRRIILIFILLIAAMQLTKAQTAKVTGSVKNEQGNALHFAFVEDTLLKTGAYTDSLGNFSITANPNSLLEFRYKGYGGAAINVANNTSLQVVLKADGAAAGNSGTISTAAKETIDNSLPVSLAHKKDQVVGNKYLFEDFGHGFVLNPSNQLIQNPGYLYDYDKMEGVLLFTENNKSVSEINRDQIKSFTLYSNKDERYVFKIVPAIDKVHYTQVLSSGKKYEIYKFTTTKFERSNYVAAGVTSHGNNYDEYVDDAAYFVFDVANNQLQPLSLKKKSVKAVFVKEADKVNKYMSDNSGDINDTYLSKLGDYMNN
jgi:hypothetical protein